MAKDDKEGGRRPAATSASPQNKKRQAVPSAQGKVTARGATASSRATPRAISAQLASSRRGALVERTPSDNNATTSRTATLALAKQTTPTSATSAQSARSAHAVIHEQQPTKPHLNIDDRPGILPESRIKKMPYTLQNSLELRIHCIGISSAVQEFAFPDGMNKQHVSMLQLFQRDNCWNFICHLWRITDLPPHNPEKKAIIGYGLDYVKAIFKGFSNIDLEVFRDDIDELYEKKAWGEFVKLMFLYTIRMIQFWCAVLDCDYDTSMSTFLGGVGHCESDHPLQNLFTVSGMLKKWFNLDAHIAHKSWSEICQEFAKICRTCCHHHNHDASADSPWSQLSNQCSNVYLLKDASDREIESYSPVAPCLVHQSEQFIALQGLTDYYCGLSATELLDVTFDQIIARYDGVAPFALGDKHRQTREKWDSSTAGQRRTAIRRTEMTMEKSCCRKCFLCEEDSLNKPAKFMSGLHLHHMLELLKGHNPSNGVCKSLEGQRFENKKTIMLCAGCHILVTYSEEEKERLAEKFRSLGYHIVEETGEIKCTNAYDGLRVVATIIEDM